jgi:hypothetical protein
VIKQQPGELLEGLQALPAKLINPPPQVPPDGSLLAYSHSRLKLSLRAFVTRRFRLKS